MKAWEEMDDHEKMLHILNTPIGRIPCDEKCNYCPIGNYKKCGDDKSYKRAKAWLKNNPDPSDNIQKSAL